MIVGYYSVLIKYCSESVVCGFDRVAKGCCSGSVKMATAARLRAAASLGLGESIFPGEA